MLACAVLFLDDANLSEIATTLLLANLCSGYRTQNARGNVIPDTNLTAQTHTVTLTAGQTGLTV
jgi:hypothetical protein